MAELQWGMAIWYLSGWVGPKGWNGWFWIVWPKPCPHSSNICHVFLIVLTVRYT